MIQKIIKSIFPGKLEAMCKTEKGSLLFGLILLGLGVAVPSLIIAFAEATAGHFFEITLVPSLLQNLSMAVWVFGGVLIALGLLHVVSANIFKGKGPFGQMLYMASMPYLVLSLVGAAVELLGFLYLNLPWAADIVGLAINIYEIYLLYIVVRTVYNMTKKNAALSVILTLVCIAIVVAIIALIFLMMIGAAVMGAKGTFGNNMILFPE